MATFRTTSDAYQFRNFYAKTVASLLDIERVDVINILSIANCAVGGDEVICFDTEIVNNIFAMGEMNLIELVDEDGCGMVPCEDHSIWWAIEDLADCSMN